jgi:hypothetical protein
MKNARLIILCISCVILVAALVIGLLFPSKTITPQQPVTTEPTAPELPSLPEREPEIPQGKYYCVAGTFYSFDIPRNYETLATGTLPSFTVGMDNVFVASFSGDTMGSYRYDGESLVSFEGENADKIIERYEFHAPLPPELEDDDEPEASSTTPITPPTLKCIYDEKEQTLCFTYGHDTLTLKRFTTDENATQWYAQYAIDSMFTFLPNYSDYQ